MYIISCRICAVQFEAKTARRVYCGQRCKDKGKPSVVNSGLTCKTCSCPMVKRAHSAPQGVAECRSCRGVEAWEYPTTRKLSSEIAHGTTGAYRNAKCRCRVCKDAHNLRIREYNAKVKARDGVTHTASLKRKKRGVSEKTPDCFMCKKPMNRVVHPPVRYPLHASCRGKAPNWIRKGLDNPRRAKFQEKIEKIAMGTSGGGLVWTSGACDWCGDHFVGVGLTCSERCKKNRKWNRQTASTFHVSPKFRNSIYERDSWTCQICLMPVDVSAGTGGNFYPSLDHIVPRSAMLLPDHSAGNLRTVHMLCNSYRRDDALSDDQVRSIVLARYSIAS